MLSSRLPTAHITRLLLGLLLLCNLTLCLGVNSLLNGLSEAFTPASGAMTMAESTEMAAMPGMEALSCHGSDDGQTTASASQGNCPMQGSLNPGTSLPVLAELLILFALPFLLPLLGAAPRLSDNWLRDPFLRERGTHPPSWPRRHLMLSVLLH